MKIHDCVQRSDEWFALRLGKVTASRSADMLAKTEKGAWRTSRRNLLMQLALEIVTQQSQESTYQTQAMQDGIDREPSAIACYEALTGVTVQLVGFCSHDTIQAGCSPDGFLGEDGLLSVKCPIPATHWDYLKTSVIPDNYAKQILHEMWITGRTWCDFLSFQPYFPEHLRAKLIRVSRVEADVQAYEKQVVAFLAEVETEVAAIMTLNDVNLMLREAAAR